VVSRRRGFDVLDDVFESATVETMVLEGPPPDVFSRTARMPALTRLDLRGARGLRAIPRLGRASPLTHLAITTAKLADIEGLADHPRLASLELAGVAGLRDLAPLVTPNLRRLVLEDCGEIETLAVLDTANLEELVLVGTTNVLDGDLRSVGVGLRGAAFPQRPHYNTTPAELTAAGG
jgi:hypothetical protein